MGVHALDETKGCSMTCEKYRSSSSSSLSASRIIGAPMRSWKVRSKSQSRLAVESRCQWTPEGRGRWRNGNDRIVVLTDVPLLEVTEAERLALQKLAVSRLQELNLGCSLEVPKSECVQVPQTKKRIMLLRKKAVTSALLDSKDKPKGTNTPCPVFGVPLTQCIASDRFRGLAGSQKDHCEEVLSALRISPQKIRSEEMTLMSSGRSSSRGSLSDISDGELQVPAIVQACIAFLESRGLETLGIFRVSGSQKRVRQLREDLDNNRTFSFENSTQPHDVAQLLKEYFRDLPEPLLPRSLYRAFLMSQRLSDYQKRIKAVRWLLYLLPVAHRDTLSVLLAFLKKVAQFAEASPRDDGTWASGNKMDSNNLATVFGPNILRMSKGSTDSPYAVHSVQRAQERSDVILTVHMLIENYKELFQVTAEDLDAVYHQMMSEDPDTVNFLLTRLLEKSRVDDSSSFVSYSISQEERSSSTGIFTASSQKSSFVSQSFVEQGEISGSTADWNVQSRVRPLMIEKEIEKQAGLPGPGQHLAERALEACRLGEQRSGTTAARQMDRTSYQPFAVTASFTITMAGKGNACVADILPQGTGEPDAATRTRRVKYGKIRHMTTPAYVTEETITTITIPPPRSIAMSRGESSSYRSLVYGPLGPSDGGETKTESHLSRRSVERQRRPRTKVVEQVSETGRPVAPERWKRQEIIASEHIQI